MNIEPNIKPIVGITITPEIDCADFISLLLAEIINPAWILTKENNLVEFFSKEDFYKISTIKDARTIYVYDDYSMLKELTLDKSFRLIKSYTPYFEEEDFYDMDDPFYSSENPRVVNNYINKLNKTYQKWD